MKYASALTAVLFLIFLQCSTNVSKDLEYINPPVDIKISAQTTPFAYTEVSFRAYNTETGFQGYGIFAGSSTTVSEAITSSDSAKTAAGLFCTTAAELENRYVVQIGGSSQVSGTHCYTSATTLNAQSIATGAGITVRGRVDRTNSPWSLPVSGVVP